MWTVAVFLLYTVLGFFLLPPIVRVIAAKQLSKQLDRPVTIHKVRLNPYTFGATIRGLLINDKDGTPLVSWDEADMNFQLVSLFSHAWVFKEVSATNIYLRAQMNKDQTLNFSDLIDKFSKPGESTAPSKPLALEIDRLTIGRLRASITDMTPRTPRRISRCASRNCSA